MRLRSVRLAHIDGSHTYDVVAQDIALVAIVEDIAGRPVVTFIPRTWDA